MSPTESAATAQPAAAATTSLDRVRGGQCFHICRIDDEMARITALRFGIAEGSTASCVTRLPAGPIIVRSGRQEIAIGRGLARRIEVTAAGKGSADAG